ncbi:MAG: hypothetical protein PHC51_01420 [bacterium]|nr:hypothetical protein [bacterium]
MGSTIKHIAESFSDFINATILLPLKDLSDIAHESGHTTSDMSTTSKSSVTYLAKSIVLQKTLVSDKNAMLHSRYYLPRC